MKHASMLTYHHFRIPPTAFSHLLASHSALAHACRYSPEQGRIIHRRSFLERRENSTRAHTHTHTQTFHEGKDAMAYDCTLFLHIDRLVWRLKGMDHGRK
ncbi:hypothetical protein BKA80DRAFT_2400 [Phyllosticta citrichinensis]